MSLTKFAIIHQLQERGYDNVVYEDNSNGFDCASIQIDEKTIIVIYPQWPGNKEKKPVNYKVVVKHYEKPNFGKIVNSVKIPFGASWKVINNRLSKLLK